MAAVRWEMIWSNLRWRVLYIWKKDAKVVHGGFMQEIICVAAIERDHWQGHIDWISLATLILNLGVDAGMHNTCQR